MANIVILGAGVMGSALANVAATTNVVTLVGTPLDKEIIDCLRSNKPHPGLGVELNQSIVAVEADNLSKATLQSAQVVVLGVSSAGVNWALEVIQRHQTTPDILALVTKGLVSATDPQSAPQTYAQTIDARITSPAGRIVGIGGPCIARELAMAYPTRVCFAANDLAVANELRNLLETDYYSITTDNDFTGLEACAALKNFMCIGVSAMFTAYRLGDSHAKNPLAALFNQAVHEIALLSRWIKQDTESVNHDSSRAGRVAAELAFDLPGMGDLHVTVGGGRNSRLGQYLGEGRTLDDILQTDMYKVTVEGVDTGKQLLSGFSNACKENALNSADFPLTRAILDVIENDIPFNFDFGKLPG